MSWCYDIWFKGFALNHVFFYYLAFIGGLKTFHKLCSKGLHSTILFVLCNSFSKSHSHLFFECPCSMEVTKGLLPNGSFLLIQVTLKQILGTISSLEHYVIQNLSILIIVVSTYMLWGERNTRIHQSSSRSIMVLASSIQVIIAHKLRRWTFKDSWLSLIAHVLDQWWDLCSWIFLVLFYGMVSMLSSLIGCFAVSWSYGFKDPDYDDFDADMVVSQVPRKEASEDF